MKPSLINARGKVALVTGAAGGIGRATVGLLRTAGARVATFDRASKGLPPECADVLRFAGDAADERMVRAAVRDTAKHFGKIDYIVSATGAAGAGTVAETSLEDWRRLMDLNLTSAFLLCREAHKHLRKPGAAVVLFSSTNGRTGGDSISGPAYAAAKAGVLNLTRSLAKEWARSGVRVNCIAPGPVATPMLDRLTGAKHASPGNSIPLKRYAEARELAGIVAFLLSPYAASMTGACLNVSGGLVLD